MKQVHKYDAHYEDLIHLLFVMTNHTFLLTISICQGTRRTSRIVYRENDLTLANGVIKYFVWNQKQSVPSFMSGCEFSTRSYIHIFGEYIRYTLFQSFLDFKNTSVSCISLSINRIALAYLLPVKTNSTTVHDYYP